MGHITKNLKGFAYIRDNQYWCVGQPCVLANIKDLYEKNELKIDRYEGGGRHMINGVDIDSLSLLEVINNVQHLGLTYKFEKDIIKALDENIVLLNENLKHKSGLYATALRTPNKDGPVNQQETIIEGARSKIWNVYVRRKKMGLGKEREESREREFCYRREKGECVRGREQEVVSEELALLSMPPKMSDRVEALEERLLVMEVSVRETLGEFRQLMLEELTKLRNKQAGDRRESPFSYMDSGAEYRMAAKKVELPSFDGTDPVEWITKAETYFDVQGSTEDMEGETIHWFNLLQEAEVGLSWTKLKRELIGRYGGRTSCNPFEELKDLSSVDEYLAEFEYISSQVSRLPEEQYLGYFIRGLVRTFNSVNRPQAMCLARDVEAEMQGEGFQRGGGIRGWKNNRDWGTGQGQKFGSGSDQGPHLGKLGIGLGPTLSIPNKPLSAAGSSPHESCSTTQGSRVSGDRFSTADRNRGTKHLPYTELMNRKAQGLCFRCGAKYQPLHRCTERQLQIVVLADNETINEAGEVITSETQEEEDDHTLECGSMVLFAKVEVPWSGWNSPTTLRIEGLLNGVALGVLIDSGASHNFISPHVVAALEFESGQKKTDWSASRRWAQVSTAGKCEKLDIQLGEFSTTAEPYVLELGEVDMILGVSWLRMFGKSVVKENSLEEKSISKQSLSKRQVEDIQQILVVYSAVFPEPQGLPPCRNVVHFITLHSEAKAVSVRPYRYPYHHKEEIEKQVGEMLKQGIIRPSSSAFSSPVILVKKKDVTIPDKYPIPVVEELLDELHGATYFSKLDLKSGYHQIRMAEEDAHKTTFRTHEGHYEFLVMPFGLTNAPATFQSTMNQIFKPYLRKFVLVFFDDILVYSKGWEEHLKHLIRFFELLCEQSFMVNRKNCVLGSRQVEYLGHLSSEQGVAIDPEKIKSVINWPIPHNVKGVRGLLGLTGYYRKFIAGYGKIARPLTELKKKDGFHWGPTTLLTFEELKKVMTQAPLLALPNFSKPFEIECDASGAGLGAVLIPHLTGRSFKVYSDQKSLRHLLHQKITTEAQQNWLAKLLGYQFEYFPLWLQEQHIQKEVEVDPFLQQVVQKLQQEDSSVVDFIGGHSGFLRTYKRITGNLYWTCMKKMIQEFVKPCDVCQRQKYEVTPARLLQPLPIPDRIWEDISLDFITGLPKSKGFQAIFVVVDRLSKYGNFTFLKHPYTARKIAELFAKEIVRLHGIPQSIVSDRDPVFMNLFWQELFRLQGTTLKMSSSYHPETDGQTEVVNRCLEAYLRCFVSEQPKNWSYWVPWAELWYNTTFHGATGKTPFEIVYGRTPPALVRFTQGETRVEAVVADLVDRDEVIRQLKYHLLRAQQQVKKFPFLVVEKKGEVSYKVQLPESAKVHPVFHISQLKKAIGNHAVEPTLPTELSLEEEDQEEPEAVLTTREIPEGGTITKQWRQLGKMRGYCEVNFLILAFRDKAVVAEGSNDRTPNKDGPVNQQETVIDGASPKYGMNLRKREFCYRREKGECARGKEQEVASG
ncbi:hypothetical protein V8G54_010797 [Vigna mungo]|uniref:Ty3/gypsy retrotransposon protein n=1 Tax=Vigna mungo TaxID=3915 RepID=A0AAQ3NYN4_VIGMU